MQNKVSDTYAKVFSYTFGQAVDIYLWFRTNPHIYSDILMNPTGGVSLPVGPAQHRTSHAHLITLSRTDRGKKNQ